MLPTVQCTWLSVTSSRPSVQWQWLKQNTMYDFVFVDKCHSVWDTGVRNGSMPEMILKVIKDLQWHDHITLVHQNWLPAELHLQHKVCLLMHPVCTGTSYHPLWRTWFHQLPSVTIVPASTLAAEQCKVCIWLSKHAFSFAGSCTWNSVPLNHHAITDTACFKRSLKTCF